MPKQQKAAKAMSFQSSLVMISSL